ncbi:hypothetical protein AAFF_G00157990 [Aldrovandia affinis]|uniref:Uncharacterized protein n=1 Tax=Aldrovandia affinis TaxID=143900 RepID=A0AAD7RNK9_9TELE|nr:hypothetical protein AAFF_G00157990 [Aldrovandia affinis]
MERSCISRVASVMCLTDSGVITTTKRYPYPDQHTVQLNVKIQITSAHVNTAVDLKTHSGKFILVITELPKPCTIRVVTKPSSSALRTRADIARIPVRTGKVIHPPRSASSLHALSSKPVLFKHYYTL